MLGAVTFLTPFAGLVALGVLLPLSAFVLAERRVDRVRKLLRLAAPGRSEWGAIVAALSAVPLLLGLAASQPAVRTQNGTRLRTDAQALFVLDVSRSMLAAGKPGGRTRLARAREATLRLHSELAEIPSGVATLTDRVLPDLFPTGDPAAFDSTVQHMKAEQPPPQSIELNASTFAPLADVASEGYFTPAARRRLLVVVTDGDSRAFNVSALARALRAGPGISLILIRVWAQGERVFGPSGQPEAYRPDPQSGVALAGLAAAAGGRVFAARDTAGAAAFARSALGSGPTTARGSETRTTPLAPYVAAVSLVPLLFVLRRRNV
ncbi:MAG: hypothetical protein QOK32_1251 [Gaiellaceae bacterium]|nr:hypothetical protein [Gaiellaceae bacterium]